MPDVDQTLARIDTELDGFVAWDATSDGAANSKADDLDDERGTCMV